MGISQKIQKNYKIFKWKFLDVGIIWKKAYINNLKFHKIWGYSAKK